jgi:predicted N-acyltransferase
VHFEACYYQGIEYCIEHGLEAFEPGAQGEHKIRRGFVPVATRSFHYIRHPALREGIRRWLGAEAEALQHYRRELESLIPYRHEADC